MKRKAYLFVIAIKGSASSYSLHVQGLHASERRKKIHVNFPHIQKYFLSLFVVYSKQDTRERKKKRLDIFSLSNIDLSM
jgi:hypothetical protein